MKRYAVSIEACHILTEQEANDLAEKIRDRLFDIDENIFICVSHYERVQNKVHDLSAIQKARRAA